jgi:acyl-CoA thioesterase YciA
MNKEHSLRHGNLEPALRLVAMPKDTNEAGDIFGGWIMSQVDIAGGIVASQLSNGRVVTIAVTDFLFKKPVLVGDLISCYANIIKIGKTSITVEIEVCAQRGGSAQECIKVTEATVVYVAVDGKGQPREVQ